MKHQVLYTVDFFTTDSLGEALRYQAQAEAGARAECKLAKDFGEAVKANMKLQRLRIKAHIPQK